ncbi:MAG: hypothetical protein DWQ47_01915 [Acidobacteria bacterium]|nr:MAG: hypothetical protein DWQ32_05465 [Acidobacteriota bacterium]REK01180.1 MAG: hypothetical protein DWQ38_01900 [Acidobacteriota bacterium]REK14136.1 MAG: hypothetical protein DWQ43_11155 [Acidobacteriota bacterium]REK44851.1 MAG: hypothetical protein DWQ47_01915 [Acidobacteriota bacterium]
MLSESSIAVRLFLTCWIVFALHFATNTVREIYPALSLGDSFSFDVSEYEGIHPDIFTLEGRGTFINNNPGASMMGAVPYLFSRPLTDRIVNSVQISRRAQPETEIAGYDTIYPLSREFYREARARGLDVKFGLAAGIMQAFLMAPLSALSAVLMFFVLYGLTGNRIASVLLAIVFAFGTPVFFRTAQLNQNLLVAHFAFYSLVCLWRPWRKDFTPGSWSYLFAGLFAGWTVVLDYSGLVAVLALGTYAFSKWYLTDPDDRKTSQLVLLGAGVAFCALILMGYQWYCFGNPLLPAQSYMPDANFTERGYRGFSIPSASLFVQNLFGLRFGLFTSAPVLLLAMMYPLWLRTNSERLPRAEIVLIAGFTLLFLIFCSANQYGWMQFNTGVRHAIPVVPFLFIPAALVLTRLPRTIAALICVIGVYCSWCLAMYRDVEQGLGVLESVKSITLEGFRLPWLWTLKNMGFVESTSAIPILVLAAAVIWVIWRFGPRTNIEREAA